MFFFHILRDIGKLFSNKYSTLSQQMATPSLQKAFTNIANQQGIPMLPAIATCTLVFLFNMHHKWKNYNKQSLLRREKHAMLRFIWWQNNFLSSVFGLKMDNLVLKVKPKKI